MLKIIFKNLWHRRGRNAWLFIELILVTALGWYIFDTPLVSIADTSLPLGYEPERMVNISMGIFPEQSPLFKSEQADSASRAESYARILADLEAMPEVESVSANADWSGLGGQGTSFTQYFAHTAGDSLHGYILTCSYYAGTKFFETMGIKSAPGSPSPRELSQMDFDYSNGVILTRAAAERFWPGENAVGKAFYYWGNDSVPTIKVLGVVENVRYQSSLRSYVMAFTPNARWEAPEEDFKFCVRLKTGVSPRVFSERITEQRSELQAGNYFIRSAKPYEDMIRHTEERQGIHAERRRQIVVGLFFLLNLVLGIVGSFFLQTERRTGEVGVHRSYGATSRNIVTMIVGEALVLAFIAFVVGDAIYLQYALSKGLAIGYVNNGSLTLIDCWQTNFWPHFGVVSAFMLAVILLCAFIGAIMPALRASRINPVDALRDE